MEVLRDAARTLRPPRGDRHGPLAPLLLALTAVTGIVDAVSYLRLGHVFVANMTGNVVFLGFALAGARGVSTAASLIALAGFLAGALAGGHLGARHSSHRGRLLRAATAAQATLVAASVLLAALSPDPPSRDVRYGLIVLLALAMGIQNAAAQRLAVPELTTTVLTRTLTGIAADSALVGGDGSRVGRRALAVAAMLLGAVVGALLALQVSIALPLALALATVVCASVAVHLLSRSAPVWTRPS